MSFTADLDEVSLDGVLSSPPTPPPPLDDADEEWMVIDPRYEVPHTPSSTSDEAPPRSGFPRDSSDVESDEEADAHNRDELVPRRKPGGYDSRVEQMLYENPELPILITDAGKSSESGGRYIVYTIKTGVSIFRAQTIRNSLDWH